ncbi:MAG TPA: hypothetical protein VLQ93_00755, partial [Myxococcaceae bacterium]|nr:hypothetical protein [Myxococcaceae bacterium]
VLFHVHRASPAYLDDVASTLQPLGHDRLPGSRWEIHPARPTPVGVDLDIMLFTAHLGYTRITGFETT